MKDIEDIYELSPMQQGMLFHTLHSPNSLFYCEQTGCVLSGSLNVPAFQKTWHQVIERHAVLRTSFHWEGIEKPLQVVHKTVTLSWVYQDWRDLPTEKEKRERLELFLQHDREQGFNLSQAPIMRFALIRLTDEEHYFVWSHHHILFDGWSRAIILKEVFAFYEVLSRGQSLALTWPRRFRDYILWLQSRNMAEAQAFWKNKLSGFTTTTTFKVSTSYLYQFNQSNHYEEQIIIVPQTVTASLQRMAKERRLTLYTLIQGAWALVLNRYSGEQDIIFGATVSGRTPELTGVESMVGLFINTLPVRVRFSPDKTVLSWLTEIQNQHVEFDRYSYTPLVEIQKLSELPPMSALFESIIAFENYPVDASLSKETRTLEIRDVRYNARTNYPVSVLAVPGHELSLSIGFDTTRFDRETIKRMLDHFVLALKAFLSNEQNRVTDLLLLDAAEFHYLVRKQNQTSVNYPKPPECLHQLFEQQTSRTPDSTAVSYEGRSLNYRQLNEQAEQLACHLKRFGVGTDTVVGLAMERSIEMVIAMLGILKAGAAYLPLEPDYPKERLDMLAAEARVNLIVTLKHLAPKLPKVKKICLDSEEAEISLHEKTSIISNATGENLAYVLYTSGSSGKPKAVMVPHRAIVNHMQWMLSTFNFTENDRVLQKTPFSFDASVWEFYAPLISGGQLVLASPGGHQELSYLINAIQANKITIFQAVPTLFQVLVLEKGFSSCQSLRHVFSGGEVLSPALAQGILKALPNTKLHNLYGPTESCIDSLFWTCKNLQGKVPIGNPIANMRAYVLDPWLNPVPQGVAGELYLSGEGLARGYLYNPETTAEKFIPNPFFHPDSDPCTRLYKTGDSVRYDNNGRLDYAGRLDYQVKVRGYRIELGEIEHALKKHQKINEAVAVAKEAQGLAAYVVSGDNLSAKEVQGFLRVRLPEHMIPSFVVFLDSLPLTSSGKVDRRRLPDPEITIKQESYAAPRTETEEILAGTWAQVLGIERIGIDDNFFELGGHSLLAMQVISRLREAFQEEIPLAFLFESATVRKLSEKIDTSRADERFLAAPPIERVERSDHMPLSFGQERLWFLEQLVPGNPFYNTLSPVRLSGNLKISVLKKAINAVVQRHEALRTTFITVKAEPCQVIHPHLTVELPVLELSDKESAHSEVMEIVKAEAEKPFDLTQGPLIRALLLRLSEDESLLLITMHHIVSDAWSVGVLIYELSALYNGFALEKDSGLSELAVQYADFAVWQRKWLHDKVLERQLSYWKKQLDGASVAIELPSDRPRPQVHTFKGRAEEIVIEPELIKRLRKLSSQKSCTLYMTLLAAFGVLVSRYTGIDDITIGTPIANRTRREIEPLIGFFVNTLVLRLDLSGNPTFMALLDRIRQMALEAYAHQDMPFEQLVEELEPERDMSRNPLVQLSFSYQNVPMPEVELEGLRISPFDFESNTVRFDLETHLWDDENSGLSGTFLYYADIFEPDTIKRMVSHFKNVLTAIVQEPENTVSAIAVLSKAEEHQLLRVWNSAPVDYPRDSTITSLFEEQVLNRPDDSALIFPDLSAKKQIELTYKGLNHRANQIAHYLKRLGVVTESIVGLFMDRSVDMVAAVLGILKAGAAYAPFDTSYPAERVTFMIEDSRASVVLTEEKLLTKINASTSKVICLDKQWNEIAKEPDNNLSTTIVPENLAYVMYTSGSTGQPKGVSVVHRSVVRLVREANYASFSKDDVFIHLAPISFDASTLEIWAPLLNGARLVIMPQQRPTLQELKDVIEEHQVTTLWLTAGLFHLAAQEKPETFKPLFQLLAGGDVLSPAYVEKILNLFPSCTVINGYGPTENTTFTCCHKMQAGIDIGNLVPIGRPVSNTEVYILDKNINPVPVGVVGELYAGGDGLSRGYWNQPDLTAERFIPHPFSTQKGERLYKTGDLVRYLPDSKIEFIGRADTQVKIRGFRVEPGEVESILSQHEAVKDAAVIVKEEPSQKYLAAYVVLRCPLPDAQKTLLEFLKDRLPQYMIPSAVVLLDAMPLTPNGKVDRNALPEPLMEARAEKTLAPRTPAEELLVSIWTQVLKLDSVGIEDNFFELGGHSLLATQVVSRIRDVFEREIALAAFFEFPTVAALAQKIDATETNKGQAIALVPVKRNGSLPLSFAQERLWFLEQLVPGNPFYNVPAAMRLDGALDFPALEASLNEIVRRHESLRTTFITVDGLPAQVINPFASVKLPLVDLQGMTEDERNKEVMRIAGQEAQTPFDLIRGPLFRASLLQLTHDSHVFLVTMHHIVSDGWSMGVFINELSSIYNAFVKRQPCPLPELPVQYPDFAIWQRQWLSGKILEEQLDYWKNNLCDLSHDLDLPSDYPRPRVHTFKGAEIPFVLERDTVTKLKTLSSRAGSTLYMTLLAGFASLLSRYSGGHEDIVVSSPIANRTHKAVESLIGFFVNTLILRIDYSNNPTFHELLKRVRQTALNAYRHQDMPFEQLVEELQPVRDMSRNPLAQVSFAFQNTPKIDIELEKLSISPLDFFSGTVRFDLEFHLWEDDKGKLKGQCMYYADLFAPETVEQMMTHYKRLLEQIAEHPETPMSELPLMSQEEQQRILVEWNNTEKDYRSDKCFHELFEIQAALTPDAAAVEFQDSYLTYKELNENANQLANHLIDLGVGPDILVGVYIERSIEMMTGLIAVLKAGGAYVPLDPSYPRERLEYMIHDAGVKVLLTQEQFSENLHAPYPVYLDKHDTLISSKSKENPLVKVEPQHLAYMIYTSGSTGKPKGTMITHMGLVNYLSWCTEAYAVAHGQGSVVHSSLSFDATITSLFSPLLAGRKVVLLPHEKEIEELSTILQSRQNFSLIKITPAHLEMLSQLLPATQSTEAARAFIIGGEALFNKTLAFWREFAPGTKLINEYGPTETVVGCCVYDATKKEGKSDVVPIGRPIANTRLYILDRYLQPVPPGACGELYICGHGLARGYINMPDLTAECFVPNPFDSGMHLYKTGDVARYLRSGNIEFRGRADEQIKIRGYRIEPGEIETLLREHKAVKDAVVIAKERQSDDKSLVAYVVPDSLAFTDISPQEQFNDSQVSAWKKVFQDSYSHSTTETDDPSFDITGWNSSYTGEMIAEEQMRQWVEYTVEEILKLSPSKVLEIGCGSGLLLYRIAPRCQAYWGTDFSTAALRHLHQGIKTFPWAAQVILRSQWADNFDGLPDNYFDTVIINSVVQYFPSVDYLVKVIESTVNLLKKGGRIFIGDVRSLPLLKAYHASVQMFRAGNDLTKSELQKHIEERIRNEEELVIDPAFFAALREKWPDVKDVVIQFKRGRYHNELTRFRYDVVLYVGESAPSLSQKVQWIKWSGQELNTALTDQLLNEKACDAVGIRNIPNARLWEEREILKWLETASPEAKVADFRALLNHNAQGIDPEYFWNLGKSGSCSVYLSPSEADIFGAYDVVFQISLSGVPLCYENTAVQPWHRYTNNPLYRKMKQTLIPELRQHLQTNVPQYMVPPVIFLLDSLPLTPNGKVDRKVLPEPERHVDEETYVAARNTTEEILTAIWTSLLGLDRVGVYDNFFELGGHSLLATQVISRIKEAFTVDLPVRELFDSPTIEALGQKLENYKNALPSVLPPIVPVDRDREIPLSFAQERLWFLDQMEQQSAAYNAATAVRLIGELNIKALEKSLAEIVNRHEALRTTFRITDEGKPVQVLKPVVPLQLVIIDLEAAADREQKMHKLIHEEIHSPFDMVNGPLFRSTLLRLDQQEHILVVSMHHIVSDGWSSGIFIREITSLYDAFCDNRPSALPDLTIQYADFACWQRQWLTGQTLNRQLDYWKSQLEGLPPLLELPTDRPRPSVQCFEGKAEHFVIEKELTEKLKTLGRQNGVTLFMTLLGAYAVLLFRYSRQEDIAIGSPIANRNHKAIEPLIGFFANTLVLRMDLSANLEFNNFLRCIRQVCLDAYMHQDVPFELVVEALQPPRHLSHNPLFQAMFVFQNTPQEERLELSGLTLEPVSLETRTAKFDLLLGMTESEGRLIGALEYSSALFDKGSAQRMIGHFLRILEAVVISAETPVGEIPLLTQSEHNQLLIEFNNTYAEIDKNKFVHELFEAQAECAPDTVAAEFGSEQITYGELNSRANQLAHFLINSGAGPDVPVGLMMKRSFNMLIGLIGILKSGSPYVPLDPSYPKERLEVMLEDSKALLVVNEELIKETILSEKQTNPSCLLEPYHLAYIIYTSGSTGKPKGVAMTHLAMSNLIHWQVENTAISRSAKTLQFTSLSFDVSFQEIFSTLAGGGSLVMIDEDVRRDPSALLEVIRSNSVERLFLPFVALQQLSAASEQNPPTMLKEIITAGEQLQISQPVARLFTELKNCAFHNHYGPSETHVATSYTLNGSVNKWPLLPPVGKPIANTRIYILDNQGQPTPVGVPGEVCISGMCLARGYLGRPDMTAEKFIANPFLTSISNIKHQTLNLPNLNTSHLSFARVYRTGDLGRFLPDGNIEFLGRIDQQVKIRGYRVEPGEIETVLTEHPNVKEAVVVVKTGKAGLKYLAAYVVVNQQIAVSESHEKLPEEMASSDFKLQTSNLSKLRSYLQEKLPEYMIPSVFIPLDSMPLTPSGKINRLALPEPDTTGQVVDKSYIAPRNEIELELTKIWQEVLEIEPVGVVDNFFELGGHSLLAVQLMAHIQKNFRLNLPLAELFKNATIEELASVLQSKAEGSEESSLVVIIQKGGRAKPFFCVPGAGGNSIYFYELARNLGKERSFYGFQSPGFKEGKVYENLTIEETASQYIKAMLEVQPEGPFLIGGHSFGGWVAFEMSRQLLTMGHDTELLVIFDTPAPFEDLTDSGLQKKDSEWLIEIAGVIGTMFGKSLNLSHNAIKNLTPQKQLAYLHEQLIQTRILPSGAGITQIQLFIEVYKANVMSMYIYRPVKQPLSAPIALFKAVDQDSLQPEVPGASRLSDEPALRWNYYTDKQIKVHHIPGDHRTMFIKPNVKQLADELNNCLNLS